MNIKKYTVLSLQYKERFFKWQIFFRDLSKYLIKLLCIKNASYLKIRERFKLLLLIIMCPGYSHHKSVFQWGPATLNYF